MSAAAVASAVRERPLIFTAESARAILAGTKMQTRRVVRPQPDWSPEVRSTRLTGPFFWPIGGLGQQCGAPITRTQYGLPGDLLWVREAWSTRLDRDHLKPRDLDPKYDSPFFWADPETCNAVCGAAAGRKRASFHLPRWASRLTLEITDVRVQRLQEISEEDAKAEGVAPLEHIGANQPILDTARGRTQATHPHVLAYAVAWDTLNDARAPWKSNPWVWAIAFKRTA